MAPDWGIVWDDMMTHALTSCTVCTRRWTQEEARSWDTWATDTLALAVAVCQRCHRGPWRAALDRLMRQRYPVPDTGRPRGEASHRDSFLGAVCFS